jgi:CheY-like chemotaxis protein
LSQRKESRTDLPQAIEEAVAKAAGFIGDKPVTVVAEYPAHLPAVRVDRPKLVGLLGSVIGHAVQAADQGEVVVTAEIWASGVGVPGSPAENPWAVVQVRLPATSMRAGLELDPTRSAATQGGTFPPLRDVQAIAAGLGGSLTVERPGESQVALRLTLPLLAAPRGEGDLRSIVEYHLAGDSKAGETLLLVIEDPVRLAEMTAELVEEGYSVIPTSTGGDVLALARKEKPDLILLDMLARDPGALDVAMVLKQDGRTLNIPVLFLTSTSDPQGERLGAASFLVRPTGTGALVSTIQAVLGAGLSPAGRVLVAEPDEVARETLVMMIQAHGYRVTEAGGAEEALALAEHIPPELVLVNADLAQERDYWLLRGLRQLGQGFEVFVLAEALTEAQGQEAVDRGASGFSQTGQLPELLDQVRKSKQRPG